MAQEKPPQSPRVPRDYYEIFGLTRHATADEIKKRYHELQKQFHPDMLGDLSPEERAQTTKASAMLSNIYAILKVDEKRRAYDLTLAPLQDESVDGHSASIEKPPIISYDLFENGLWYITRDGEQISKRGYTSVRKFLGLTVASAPGGDSDSEPDSDATSGGRYIINPNTGEELSGPYRTLSLVHGAIVASYKRNFGIRQTLINPDEGKPFDAHAHFDVIRFEGGRLIGSNGLSDYELDSRTGTKTLIKSSKYG